MIFLSNNNDFEMIFLTSLSLKTKFLSVASLLTHCHNFQTAFTFRVVISIIIAFLLFITFLFGQSFFPHLCYSLFHVVPIKYSKWQHQRLFNFCMRLFVELNSLIFFFLFVLKIQTEVNKTKSVVLGQSHQAKSLNK